MAPREISAWLREGRAILAAFDGGDDRPVRIAIVHADTGLGIEFVLPPANEDGEPRYVPTDAEVPPRRVVLTPDTSMPVLGEVPGPAIPTLVHGVRLRSVHRRLLSAATTTAMKAEKVCRIAGLSCNSSSRAALADLVRWDLLRHGPDGYWKPAGE